MPTFDVVSRLDMQEVRNAADQAAREVSTRYDFRNTGTSVVLGDGSITMSSSTEDRLAAARIVLEEKLVRRKVSLKALSERSPILGPRRVGGSRLRPMTSAGWARDYG